MKQRPALMTIGLMVNATEMAKLRIRTWLELAEEVKTDARRADRLKQHECKACFYGSRLGGAAMTERDCMCCGKASLHSSTNTPVLCMECAKETGLCVHCGADLQLKTRRKGWPTPKLAPLQCSDRFVRFGDQLVHARNGRPLRDEFNNVIPASQCICAANSAEDCTCGTWELLAADAPEDDS